MNLSPAIWQTPAAHLAHYLPDQPLIYFVPERLRASTQEFLDHYPGLVSYAVKANDAPVVLQNLVALGVQTFDVASVAEMQAVRDACPTAVLHYNNPVRSIDEIKRSKEFDIRSYSVDSLSELDKLASIVAPDGVEVSVRLKLAVEGAKYDFGSKFGTDPELAEHLLKRVADLGYDPALTFHPGTQCADPAAWVSYISVCAQIAKRTGVQIKRLNTGGGFAAHRAHHAPEITPIFSAIKAAVSDAFGASLPDLICEPGRAIVADAFILATRVKALRDDGSVFLNDGTYGSFGESHSMGTVERVTVVGADGGIKTGPSRARVVFGPTCDSLDRLPEPVDLPDDLAEGDYVLFHGMGAYALATVTAFNGYGDVGLVTVSTG